MSENLILSFNVTDWQYEDIDKLRAFAQSIEDGENPDVPTTPPVNSPEIPEWVTNHIKKYFPGSVVPYYRNEELVIRPVQIRIAFPADVTENMKQLKVSTGKTNEQGGLRVIKIPDDARKVIEGQIIWALRPFLPGGKGIDGGSGVVLLGDATYPYYFVSRQIVMPLN